jgi:hypothetical protein
MGIALQYMRTNNFDTWQIVGFFTLVLTIVCLVGVGLILGGALSGIQ